MQRRTGWIVGLVLGGLAVAPFAFAAVEQLDGEQHAIAIAALVLSLAPFVLLVAWSQLRHLLGAARLAWRGLRYAAGDRVVARANDEAAGPFVHPSRRLRLERRAQSAGRRALAISVLVAALAVCVAAGERALTRVQQLRSEPVTAIVVRPWSINQHDLRAAQAAWERAGGAGRLPELPAPDASPIDGFEYAIVAYEDPERDTLRVAQEDFSDTPRVGDRTELLVAGDEHQQARSVPGDLAIYVAVLALGAVIAGTMLPAAAGRVLVLHERS